MAGLVGQAEEVVGEVVDVVVGDRLGPVGLAVAALIGADHLVPGVGQGGHLVAPRVRELRAAVGEDDGEPVSGLADVRLDPVGDDASLTGRRGGRGGGQLLRFSSGRRCRRGRTGVRWRTGRWLLLAYGDELASGEN